MTDRLVTQSDYRFGRMLYSQPRRLPWDVALQIAEKAKVASDEQQPFCRGVCGAVQEVWEWDRRALPSAPSDALNDAANAARALMRALQELTEDDRKWFKTVVTQHYYPEFIENLLHDLDRTVLVLAHAFNAAIGKHLFNSAPVASRKRGRRRGTFNDQAFHDLIYALLLSVFVADGELTFDKNSKKGTLVDVLNILRPHLPKGVIPNCLPYSTIQKIKTEFYRTIH